MSYTYLLLGCGENGLQKFVYRDLSNTQREMGLLCSQLGMIVQEKVQALTQDKEKAVTFLQDKSEMCSKVRKI